MINVIKLLNDYDITMHTEGKNCQEGWVNINCPFCNDKSNHLGFNLEGHYFSCWHCGRLDTFKVIRRLTHEKIFKIKEKYEVETIIRRHLRKKKTEKKPFIIPETKITSIHKKYLRKRKFDPDYIIKKYDLRGTVLIPKSYKYRIIAPVYRENKIVSFQGRDVTDRQELRYKACSKEREIICHQNILYNLDNCNENWVAVTEGITDVWRLGDNSCSCFGIEYTPLQVLCLSDYEIVFTIFDPEPEAQKMAKKLGRELVKLGVQVFNIIITAEDPAKLKQDDADYLMEHLI